MDDRVQFNRILLMLLLLKGTVYVTRATTVQHFYKMQKLGKNVTGTIVKELAVISGRECSLRWEEVTFSIGNCIYVNNY